MPTKPPINCKPTDQARWDGRVARQTAGYFGRQLGQRDTGRGKGVVSGDLAGWAERHEAVAQSASRILRGAFAQVLIERFNAAAKTGAIVTLAQRFDDDAFYHREAAMILR